MPRPPFRADHVGSFLRPERLREARERFAAGGLPAAELHAIEDACIREVVRAQEDVGLKGITDGEFRRTFFHVDFLERFEGVETTYGEFAAHFRKDDGTKVGFAPPTMHVGSKVKWVGPIQGAGLRFSEVDDDAHAESLHPRAVDAAFPRRARGDQRGGLSAP